ncbi:putative Integrase [Pararobbsia alpina]
MFASSRDTDMVLAGLLPFATRSTSYHSQLLEAEYLKGLSRLVASTEIKTLPASDVEWQVLVDSCYELHLRNRTLTLQKRKIQWINHYQKQFTHLRDIALLIPSNVIIPPKNGFLKLPSHRESPTILGKGRRPTRHANGSETLINLDISKTDAEYLENFKTSLINARAAVDSDFVAYVISMSEHYAYGQKLLAMCTQAQWKEIKQRFDRVQTHILDSPYNAMHKALEGEIFPGSTEISLARILRAYSENSQGPSNDQAFKNNPWLPSWQRLRLPDLCPAAPTDSFSTAARFAWMCGEISVTDLTVIHALLMVRNPKFNALPLFDSVIRDKHGKFHFEVVIDGISFLVDKRRASTQKTSTLDEMSQLAITVLLDMTQSSRVLMKIDDVLRDRLFFLRDRNGAKPAHYTSLYAFNGVGEHKRRIQNFLPRIASSKTIVHINPARLRSTSAVLAWFKSGSVLEAARELGNSTRVVLEHYIPRALIDAWNTRIARRFHNLNLCVATANETYAFESTDFHSIDEMRAFIADMLSQHAAASSELAALLHSRLARNDAPSDAHELSSVEGTGLVVPIGVESLSIMYAYRDQIYQRGVRSPARDLEASSVLSEATAVELADLLSTRLPSHENMAYRKVHQDAILEARKISQNIDKSAQMTVRALESDYD